LHNLTAYFILPIFAFANAGVVLSTSSELNTSLILYIAISLFAGKLIGVSLFSYLGVKLKLTELPSGINFKQIIGIAGIAGVGFTMSIFIANLTIGNDAININSSIVGIIIVSFVSVLVGVIILRLISKKRN